MNNKLFFLFLAFSGYLFSSRTSMSHKALVALIKNCRAQRKGGRVFVDSSEFKRSWNGSWVLVERSKKIK